LAARIDVGKGQSGVSVRVSGRLDEPVARELRELCQRQTGALLLDLESLRSADEAALAILRELRDAGGRIVGASPYIRLLLDGDSGAEAVPGSESNEAEE
jgi:anti-anti-sigma regulatory factor